MVLILWFIRTWEHTLSPWLVSTGPKILIQANIDLIRGKMLPYVRYFENLLKRETKIDEEAIYRMAELWSKSTEKAKIVANMVKE